MRSVVVTELSQQFDKIQIQQREIPEPGPGQVRVRMLMAAVNPSDRNFVRGDYLQALQRLLWNRGKTKPSFDPAGVQVYPSLPYALGGEGVGIVDACGSGLMAKRLKGKRVAISAGPPNGTWQDYTVVDAKRAIPVPASLSNEQAAMFIINPLSAYAMCRHVLSMSKGQWLLQSGAGSALGKMVVRLGREYGFKTISIIRSEVHRQALLDAGADVVINSETENILERVAEVTKGLGAAGAMDCIGGKVAAQMLLCLGMRGQLVVYGTLSGENIELPSRDLMMPGNKISGFFAGSWLATQSPLTLLSTIRQLGKLAKKGIFLTPIEKQFPLEQAAEALAFSFEPARQGKILLNINPT